MSLLGITSFLFSAPTTLPPPTEDHRKVRLLWQRYLDPASAMQTLILAHVQRGNSILQSRSTIKQHQSIDALLGCCISSAITSVSLPRGVHPAVAKASRSSPAKLAQEPDTQISVKQDNCDASCAMCAASLMEGSQEDALWIRTISLVVNLSCVESVGLGVSDDLVRPDAITRTVLRAG